MVKWLQTCLSTSKTFSLHVHNIWQYISTELFKVTITQDVRHIYKFEAWSKCNLRPANSLIVRLIKCPFNNSVLGRFTLYRTLAGFFLVNCTFSKVTQKVQTKLSIEPYFLKWDLPIMKHLGISDKEPNLHTKNLLAGSTADSGEILLLANLRHKSILFKLANQCLKGVIFEFEKVDSPCFLPLKIWQNLRKTPNYFKISCFKL